MRGFHANLPVSRVYEFYHVSLLDKKSQRAAWTVVDKTRPITDTGINNLTEDMAPALVHFDDDQTQQWLLVRLEELAE